ncbi:hypothetical protein DRO61_03295 [Candidatus Bathyarchaeota archaeon]|nr:MAG: hypothetical protein DRO61_03295 [Candidatus Bathyarchaeota archaeon]
MSNYNIQIPGEKRWDDNRESNLKGRLSQPGDIEEAFREVCSLNKRKLSDMRPMVKVNKPPMNITGLSLTCIELGLVLIVDGSLDFFCVKHQEKGDIPVSMPEPVGGALEEIEEVEEIEETEDDRFQEIDSEDPVSEEMKVEDDEEELF